MSKRLITVPSEAALGFSRKERDVTLSHPARPEARIAHDVARRVALASIRAVHSLIFAFILACIGWLIRTGIAGRQDRTVGLAAGVVAAEAAIWIANDRVCPLTPFAERLGAQRGSVSDIFLPDVVARTLPIWSSALIAGAAVLHARSVWPSLRSFGSTRPSGPRHHEDRDQRPRWS